MRNWRRDTRLTGCFPLSAPTASRAATADIGLVPVASLAVTPGLRILPGCTIASKHRVRSLLLVRRARQPLAHAAHGRSRHRQPHHHRPCPHPVSPLGEFLAPIFAHAGNLDAMLDRADAAIVIGDPALLALEERANREERTGEELVYHDLAEEWRGVTGLPFVSAVWGSIGTPSWSFG